MAKGEIIKKEIKEPSAEKKEIAPEVKPEVKKETLKGVVEKQGVKVEEMSRILKNRGTKFEDTLEKSDAIDEETEEFNEGEKKIEGEASDIKESYDKEIEQFSETGKERQEEILNELRDIRSETETVYSSKIPDEEKTKILERLDESKAELNLEYSNIYKKLEKHEELGGEPKNIPAEKGDIKEFDAGKKEIEDRVFNVETVSAVSAETVEEIKKLLKDPTSELSILTKAVNFREGHIPKLRDDLEKTKASKIDTLEKVKFSEKNIKEHENVLAKHKDRIREILNKLEMKSR